MEMKRTGKPGRKRKSESWDSIVDDDDYIDDDFPVKKSRRIAQSGWADTRAMCQKIVHELMNHKYGWPFNQPVDPVQLQIPDYFDKIKRPMDFGTIKSNLDEFKYESTAQFAEDVRQVFNNCWTYNPPGSDVYVMASALSTIFEKRFKNVVTSDLRRKTKRTSSEPEEEEVLPVRAQDDEISQMHSVIHELKNEHQKLLNELSKLVKKANAPPTPRVPKPKAAPKPRKPRQPRIKIQKTEEEFNFKQKERLSVKIEKLSPENLQKMVDYMGPELVDPQKQSAVLEIDLEILSVQTLKKLDQFVDSCLKAQGTNIDELPATTTTKTEDDSSDSDSSSSSDSSDDSESDNDTNSVGKANEVSA